jgi:type I restriction enzyme, R subunit
VPVEYRDPSGRLRHDTARLADFDDVAVNDFVVVNQLSVERDQHVRRPDVFGFVNGLPLVLVELKVPGQPGAALHRAWNQLGTYAAQIPALIAFPAVSLISTHTRPGWAPWAAGLSTTRRGRRLRPCSPTSAPVW